MSGIFISYRREDSIAYAGRLYDRLADQFGKERIFMDIDTMKVGLDFVEQIENAVQTCDVLIAVIGKTWVTSEDEDGHRRLDNPEDFVRVEIQAALKRNIPVVPLLVGGAKMPKATELQEAIAKLSRRHAMTMSDERFRADASRLIDAVKEYLTEDMPESASTAEVKKPARDKRRKKSRVKQTLSTPEDMVLVPRGPFLYGDERKRETIDYDYWIAIYPVTNEKYRAFILADGYGNQSCWSNEGWKWRTENNIITPGFWSDPQWIEPNHPVVGVTFYEAEAYSRWAGKRLPTEREWEKAARGTDGRVYPWGDEFDKTRCNSLESGFGITTPVTNYPQGVSPYGCYDIAGNVWEWCTTWWHHEESGRRVIRGGSWYNRPGFLRASEENWHYADYRNYSLGFRLAQGAE